MKATGRRKDNRYKIRSDLEPRSFWLVTTPSATQLEQPFACTEAGTLYGREHFLTERQGKDSYLLFYTFGGAGYVRQGGRTATVRHGQALLMDCRTPQAYGTSPQADHWHHFWAHVEGAGVNAAAKRLGLPTLSPHIVSRTRIVTHFQTIFDRLETESIENGELIGIAVHSILSELLIAKAREEVPEDSPVVVAQSFIASHYAEHIAIEDLARAASVSPSYLTRLFRQSVGTSPHDYLIRFRITRAKQLLAETTLPVGDVAIQTGFGSTSNFSYRFSAVTGISPRSYRALAKSNPIVPTS
ncbi:MAG: helix-turn-helix domain-containing protein [Atopobiaceae bacterium]|nr:helix-turn-helix domain-containing protein [Atopobiaceae bacterium]